MNEEIIIWRFRIYYELFNRYMLKRWRFYIIWPWYHEEGLGTRTVFRIMLWIFRLDIMWITDFEWATFGSCTQRGPIIIWRPK